MSFVPGQRVVCIRVYLWVLRPNNPNVDDVYTVRGTMWDEVANIEGVWLQEIKNPIIESDSYVGEAAFRGDQFRPLAEQIVKQTSKLISPCPSRFVLAASRATRPWEPVSGGGNANDHS